MSIRHASPKNIKAEIGRYLAHYPSYPIILERMMKIGFRPGRRDLDNNGIWNHKKDALIVPGDKILGHARFLKTNNVVFGVFRRKPLVEFLSI